MRIQWLGTAGFRIEFGGTIFLVDPYLTRNKEAFPRQNLTPEDFAGAFYSGHSRICEIAVRYVELLSPKLVIPHHWDDFFPPVSKTVDISPFVEWVEHSCPRTRVQVLDLNQTLSLE